MFFERSFLLFCCYFSFSGWMLKAVLALYYEKTGTIGKFSFPDCAGFIYLPLFAGIEVSGGPDRN